MSTTTDHEIAADAPFEQVLTRLEQMVAELEQGELPLEHSLATFEAGIALARLGAKRLDEAEKRIEVLLSNSEEPEAS